jgi:hypothetical protein
MSTETHQKVTVSHLKRCAYLYVRQSTMRQVLENTESTDPICTPPTCHRTRLAG